MSQLSQVCQTLKNALKHQHITYKQLAAHLHMSEANIKRMFSTHQFTLARLEEICQFLKFSLSDLFLLVENEQTKLIQLSAEQEQELVDDVKLFLVAACVRDGWSFNEIIHHYQINEFECIQLMAKLDRLKMIQLLPNNQYKILIAQDFQWITNGPLERYMAKDVIGKFMASSFDGENSFRFYLRGTYSQSSIDIITRKLNQLTKEVAVLNQEDASLPLENRQHIGLVFAMRPWELSQFEALKK